MEYTHSKSFPSNARHIYTNIVNGVLRYEWIVTALYAGIYFTNNPFEQEEHIEQSGPKQLPKQPQV